MEPPPPSAIIELTVNALIACEDDRHRWVSRTVFDRMSKDEYHRDVRAKRERVLEIHLCLASPKDDLKAEPIRRSHPRKPRFPDAMSMS